MITRENVTDEQIRELRESAARWLDSVNLNSERVDYDAYAARNLEHYFASVALGVRRARRGGSKEKARARCAEILDARAKAAK